MQVASLLCCLLLIEGGLAQVPSPPPPAVSYQYYIDLTFTKTDIGISSSGRSIQAAVQNPIPDGLIQCDEFSYMILMLDMEDDVPNPTVECTLADANGDGGVSEQELIEYFENGADPSLATTFIERLTGVPDADSVSSIGEVSDAVRDAEAFTEMVFTINENPESLMAGEREALRERCRDALDPSGSLGLPLENVYQSLEGGSSVVTTRAFFETEEQANAASANAQTSMGTPQAATAFLSQGGFSYTVVTAPTIEVRRPLGTSELDMSTPVVIGILMVVLIILTCIIGCFSSSARRKAKGVTSSGCCGGCCSVYALRGWGGSSLLAALALLAASFVMFNAMENTTSAIENILAHIDELLDQPEGSDGRAAVQELEDTLTIIDPIRPYTSLLGLAVILPAVLAAVCMLIAGLCAMRDAGTLCIGKTFLLLAQLLLIICIIFYALFAALGPVVQQPFAEEMLSTITALCETTEPLLRQTVQDAGAALDNAMNVQGVDPADIQEIQDQLALAEPALDIFSGLCDEVTILFDEFVELFVPGCCCIIASIFALYTSCITCCSAKCCRSPKENSSKHGDVVKV